MEKKCFNCDSPQHISLRCPAPQLYSRCIECSNVCFNEAQHKKGCWSSSFRSIFLGAVDEITELGEILSIKFKLIDVILVKSTREDKLLSQTPLWIGNTNITLRKINDVLCLESTNNEKRIIGIQDENNMRRLKLEVSPESLLVNDYFSFSSNGSTKYNRSSVQNAFGKSDCELKVYTNGEFFKMRITWNGMKNCFDVYPHGIVLRDPFEIELKNIGNTKFVLFYF